MKEETKEDTTINIQDLFNERVEQNKRIEELVNINEKLSLALESAEQRIDKAIEELKVILKMAKDYEEVNLVDRLKIILKTLRGKK